MTKTRKFLIVSHGALAGGFRSALELITGAAGEVFVVQAYVDENKPVEEELFHLLRNAGPVTDNAGADGGAAVEPGVDGKRPDSGEEWVVFTDLLGGSITNQVLRVMAELPGKTDVHVVAGINLPLVIEVVLGDLSSPLSDLLAEAVGRAREQLIYVNSIING